MQPNHYTLIRLIAIFCIAQSAVALAAEPKAAEQNLTEPEATEPKAAQQPPDETPTVRLKLQPAPEPRPALKYHLLPPLLDRQPGNAAVFYNKAALIYQQRSNLAKQGDRIAQWLEAPYEALPLAEIETTLQPWTNVFEQVDLGAKREHCDWQMPFREQTPFTILLPEVQELRAVVRALVVKARLQVARHQFDEAVKTLQTGYSLARHFAAGDTYIHALVGMATIHQLAIAHDDLVQQSGAPNLYWSLTWLPRPLVDLRHGAEFEMSSIYFWRPELSQLDQHSRTPDGWRQLLDDFVAGLAQFDSGFKRDQPWLLVARAIKGYPRAKRELIERGRLPEQVETMPVAQVLLLHMVQTYNDLRDDHFKWATLPFSEARAGLQRANENFQRDSRREIIPLAQILLPAVQSVANGQARGERTIAMLRTIEAIRMYAAAHEGRLPEQLDDITEVPVPRDPFTGGPFIYRCSENTAVLEAPRFEGMPDQMGKRYVLSVAE